MDGKRVRAYQVLRRRTAVVAVGGLMAIGGLAVAAPPAHAESFVISIFDQAHDALSGEAFGQYPIVQVVGDLSGSPKVGWTVTASVSGTGASLVGTASQTTDSNGRAPSPTSASGGRSACRTPSPSPQPA